MASISSVAGQAAPATTLRASPFLLGLAGAAVFLALHLAAGLPTLADNRGDNDSLMRLVVVRDLLAGQGWFDTTQYRLGTGGGLAMHWSRLVDAPLALLVLAGSAIGGSQAAGESFALIAWPTMLFAAALGAMAWLARRLGGMGALLPVLVAGGAALHYTAIFAPGAIDHHNLQLALCLACLALLVAAADTGRWQPAAGAGLAAAAMLAVAMEAAPYVAVAGAAAALLLLADPVRNRAVAAGFGAGFGAGGALAFLATVPPPAWGAAQCDAYSLPQLSLAVFGGFGLAAVALLLRPARAVAGLGLLGAGAVALLVVAFPQCLADPYAGLDPRLVDWWLDAVTEAQPLSKILALDPAMAAGHYVTPVIGLGWLLWMVLRDGERRPVLLVAGFLAVSLLVSVWQVRGSLFSLPLAAVPLAAMIATAREKAATSLRALPLMVAAWLVALPMGWVMAAGSLAPSGTGEPAADAVLPASTCLSAADYAGLAALPATGVLAVSNLGTAILVHTPHRVLAAPYHRNVAGNLAAIEAFAGPPEAAPALMRRHGMSLVAVCPGNSETALFTARAPDGLMAALLAGRPPDGLEPVGSSEDALHLYRLLD